MIDFAAMGNEIIDDSDSMEMISIEKTNMLQPPGHTACTDHFPHLPVTSRCKLSNNLFLIVMIINTTCFDTKFLQLQGAPKFLVFYIRGWGGWGLRFDPWC